MSSRSKVILEKVGRKLDRLGSRFYQMRQHTIFDVGRSVINGIGFYLWSDSVVFQVRWIIKIVRLLENLP
jgi:hypothetical protein